MKYFETTIKVPLPDGPFERARVIGSLEAAFDALAKGLAKAAIDGVEVKQREFTIKGPRAAKAPVEATESTGATSNE